MTYPLDTTGTASSNLLIGESHSALESTFKNLNYIIPACAPFYGSSLVVQRVSLTTGTTNLVLNQDYNLAMIYLAATDSVGIAIYGGIVLLGNYQSTDIIKITYQTLGGPWVANVPQVLQNIIDSTFNPQIMSWDQVTNVQQTFPPTNHTNTMDLTYGLDSLLTSINALSTTVANKGATPLNLTLGSGVNGTQQLFDGNTLHATDASKLLYYNNATTAGGITIPDPRTCNNITMYFSNINNGFLTINSALANSIYAQGNTGVTSVILQLGMYVTLTSNGSAWLQVSGNVTIPFTTVAMVNLFSGDGTTTNFTLTNNPGSQNNLAVEVNGVGQRPGIDFTWSPNFTLVFTSAPYTGTNNILVRYTTGLSINNTNAAAVTYIPSNGSSATNVQAQLDYIQSNAYAAAIYTPSGTGAVVTTVQDELSKTIWADRFIPLGTNTATTNVQSYIQAALDYAATLGHAKVEFPYGASFKCNSGLTIDTNKVKVNGNGSFIDFSGMTTGDAVAIIQSNADGNMRNALNHTNPVDSLVFVGPGLATTAVRCVNINDATGTNISSGVTFNSCAFINFAKDVNFGNGAFCCTFNKCNFTTLTGTATTYSVEMLSASLNAGERNRFVDCMWNNRDFVYNQTNANANAFFDECSFDYSPTRVMTVTGGAVYINGGHIEQNSDANYYFYVSGTNSLIQIADVDYVGQAAKASFSPFYSDATATQGGISIRDCIINQVGNITTKLVNGTGRTAVDNIVFLASSSKPTLSAWQNYLAYGGFESANYTAEWTLGVATRSSAQAHSGTWSLSFPASSGVTPYAVLTMPVKPGQTVLGECWYLVPTITGTSGTFYVVIDWLDKGGNSLGSSGQLILTTNVAVWTRLPLYFNGTAPAGTVNYRLNISLFGVASGTPTAYLDDVNLAVV